MVDVGDTTDSRVYHLRLPSCSMGPSRGAGASTLAKEHVNPHGDEQCRKRFAKSLRFTSLLRSFVVLGY